MIIISNDSSFCFNDTFAKILFKLNLTCFLANLHQYAVLQLHEFIAINSANCYEPINMMLPKLVGSCSEFMVIDLASLGDSPKFKSLLSKLGK